MKMRRRFFPAWYLPEGTKNASETELEFGSSSCESWGVSSGLVVAASVVIEFVIAWCHPSYNSSLERWGSFWADFGILLGISGEIFFSSRDSKIQTELRARSNARVEAATKAAGEAHERAAVAERETAEAKRQLRSWREPRRILDRAAFLQKLKDVPTPLTVEILYSGASNEAGLLAYEMHILLGKDAEWPVGIPERLVPNDKRLLAGAAATITIERTSSGIGIWISPEDKEKNRDAVIQLMALRSAIDKTIGVVKADCRESVSVGHLEVVIFPKA